MKTTLTQQEYEQAKLPSNVEKLLDEVEDKVLSMTYQANAYNYLIEYLENPEWFTSHEGQRLLGLSLEILHALK